MTARTSAPSSRSSRFPPGEVLQRCAQDHDGHLRRAYREAAVTRSAGGVRYFEMHPVRDQEAARPSRTPVLEDLDDRRFIVGVEPYGFSGALMSIAAPYAWFEGGAVVDRATVRAA